MKLTRKKEKVGGYAVGVSAEVYKMLEEVKQNMDQKISLQSLASELLKEAIRNIEWVDDKEETDEDISLEKLMKERI